MRKFIEKFSLLLMLSCVICLVSCKDKSDNPVDPVDPNTPITQQRAMAALMEFAQSSNQFAATVKEGGNNVDATGLTPTKNLHGTKAYPVISCEALENGTWRVVCDYGTTPVLCNDGYYRRGVVNIVTTGFFTTVGTTMTLTFENFHQRGNNWSAQEYKIEGTQVIVNAGHNAANPERIDYNVVVTDGLITYNTKEIQYTETTTRSLLSGSELCDNNWYITGAWSGVSSDDVPYTLIANSTPLHYRICCHFFQDGILNVDIEGLPAFLIDYGYSEEDSDCDRKAQLIFPGIDPIVFDM